MEQNISAALGQRVKVADTAPMNEPLPQNNIAWKILKGLARLLGFGKKKEGFIA